MTASSFESLALDPKILSALEEAGYKEPTEVQAAAIPIVLGGADLMATAQTGTGKTAAFCLPILQQMLNESSSGSGDSSKQKGRIRSLILSPTRELAQQIEESLIVYSKNLSLSILSVVGGLPIQKQIRALKDGVDVLVATPGRLLDLMNRKQVDLRKVSFFVLDEADRMLDMGFVHDVRDIARILRKERQTLLFSATTSSEVQSLSRVLLNDPQKVAIDPPQSVGEKITQQVCFVDKGDKRSLLAELLEQEGAERVLVFVATRSNADLICAVLNKKDVSADAIHSDKNQKARQTALKAFDDGSVRVLVATDVMARGIDVGGITHVINYELPSDSESFVHRVGRTARAGTTGVAISFCDLDEVKSLQSIERFIGEELEVNDAHSFHSPFIQTMKGNTGSPFAGMSRGRRGGRRRR